MPTLEQLRTRRAELVSQAQTHNSTIEAAEGDAPAEAVKGFADAEAAIKGVDAQITDAITRAASLDALRERAEQTDRVGNGPAPGGIELPSHNPATAARHPYSTDKVFRHLAGACRLDGIEREDHQELSRYRADTKGVIIPHTAEIRFRDVTPSTAAGVISTEVRLPIVEALRNMMVLGRLGIKMLPAEGPFKLGKAQTVNTFIVDGTSPTPTDTGVGQVSFNLFTLGAKVKIQRKTLLSAAIDYQSYIWQTILADIALNIQRFAIVGTGSSQPKGLFAHTAPDGVSIFATAGANGAALTYDDLIAMTGLVDAANASTGSQAWLTSPKGASKLERTPIVSGHPTFCLDRSSNTCVGRPFASTGHVPDNLVEGSSSTLTGIAFAAWEFAGLGLFSGIDMYANPYTDDGGMTITGFQDFDFQLLRPEAFALCKDFNAA